MVDDVEQAAERLLASLSPSMLDRLAGLIAAKLTAQNGGSVLPKQKVASSNLVSRSKPRVENNPRTKNSQVRLLSPPEMGGKDPAQRTAFDRSGSGNNIASPQIFRRCARITIDEGVRSDDTTPRRIQVLEPVRHPEPGGDVSAGTAPRQS
jgi:hypothetical protein